MFNSLSANKKQTIWHCLPPCSMVASWVGWSENNTKVFAHREQLKSGLPLVLGFNIYHAKNQLKITPGLPKSFTQGRQREGSFVSVYAIYKHIFYHGEGPGGQIIVSWCVECLHSERHYKLNPLGDTEEPDRMWSWGRLSRWRKTKLKHSQSRTDRFNIKKIGIQTNKPLNWNHGRYTYRLISCFWNACFIVLRQQGQLINTNPLIRLPHFFIIGSRLPSGTLG